MSNKYIRKKDVLFLGTLCVFVLCLFFAVTIPNKIFGSEIDWVSQHSVLPDYFRQHFYNTKVFFPKLALSLGGGQNIYNFAYHGLFNPLYLISWIFPFLSMVSYTQIINIVVVILSIILMYIWLRKNTFNDSIVMVSTFLFACSSPLMYHCHKQVMFIDYMPFLIMGLMGVDRLFKYKKRGLLIINITLMLFTSYFFAVSGLFAITIYAIYKFLDSKIEKSIKSFLKTACTYGICVITAILCSGILIIPSFASILIGRESKASPDSLLKYFIPEFPQENLLYSPYGAGLTGIVIIALLGFLIIKKQPAKRFLSISLLIICCFPISKYILNGTLYPRPKALIPFIPIFIYLTGLFFNEIKARDFSFKKLIVIISIGMCIMFVTVRSKFILIFSIGTFLDLSITLLFMYLYKKKNKTLLLYLPIMIISCCVAIVSCFSDIFLTTKQLNTIYSNDKISLLNETVGKDDSIYRSNDFCDNLATNNIIYNKNFRQTGVYSSISNSYYGNLYNDILSIANPTINCISYTNSSDPVFLKYLGVKYIVSDKGAPYGYTPINSKGRYSLYKNSNVFSIGYAGYNLLNYNDFYNLDTPNRELAFLNSIVTDSNSNFKYKSIVEKADFSLDLEKDFGFKPTENGYYKANFIKDTNFKINIPDNLIDYTYIITCHIKEILPTRRTRIIINGINNTLSSGDAALPNSNYDFKFFISDYKDNKQLDITFSKGDYEIKDFTIKKISNNNITNAETNFDQLQNIIFNNNDTITGNIHVKCDGYFATTLPFDKGYKIFIDESEIPVERVNYGFIGCKITSGSHNIKIIYTPPYYYVGCICSILGIIFFIILLLWQKLYHLFPHVNLD